MNTSIDDFYEDCIQDKSIAIFSWKGQPIHEMSNEHIQNCINYLSGKEDGKFWLEIFNGELEYRKQIKQ